MSDDNPFTPQAEIDAFVSIISTGAARPPCPTHARAIELAHAWAAGAEPSPELLVWVRAWMMDHWGGEAAGAGTVAGYQLTYGLGAALGILLEMTPAGAHGVLALCELAGWPRPDGTPLT